MTEVFHPDATMRDSHCWTGRVSTAKLRSPVVAS
jgi:hypothetical protein